MITLIESRPAINYILGDQFDDQYQSKRQQKKLLRVATIKARANAIYAEESREETKPIDGPISFPLINPNRIIMPYYDALVLTLYIYGFDVHKVLVDPGSMADLLQLPAFEQMRANEILFRNAALSQADHLRFQRGNYHNTRRCRSLCGGGANDLAGSILNSQRLGALQRHSGAG